MYQNLLRRAYLVNRLEILKNLESNHLELFPYLEGLSAIVGVIFNVEKLLFTQGFIGNIKEIDGLKWFNDIFNRVFSDTTDFLRDLHHLPIPQGSSAELKAWFNDPDNHERISQIGNLCLNYK